MKYNTFIEGAPDISEIGLGAWQLGADSGWSTMSEKEAVDMVHFALDSGINFFDTAPNYGYGSSETRLGKALKGTDRDAIVINTKFGHTAAGDTNYTAAHIRESLEGSLRRLQMEYVDSLIIHNPPFDHLDGRKNEHYRILEDLKSEGKIRAYGASLDTFDEMKLLMETTGAGVIEAFFNILHQDAGRAFSMAREKDVGIIVKIPLDSGWLTGKYHAESTFNDVRDRWTREDIRTRARLTERVREIIGPDREMAKAAIAFCLAREEVSTVIPGNANLAQLKSNLASVNEPLPKEVTESLTAFYREEVEPLNLPW